LLAAALLSGCDQGSPELDELDSPPLHLISVFPEPNAGIDCQLEADGGVASPTCGVSRKTTIELRFDRYLEPDAAIRQSIVLFQRLNEDDQPIGGAFLQPDYDLVERVVVYRLNRERHPDGLDPGSLYKVRVVAPAEAGADGFKAFDGAPLTADGSVALEFQFRTATAPAEWPPEQPAPTCRDMIERVFPGAGCQSPGCHNGVEDPDCPPRMAQDPQGECVGVPRMGLRFESAPGLVETAIRRVAHQTDIGSQAGVPLQNPARVGVAMPIIDPGKPGNSYLLYKLLRRPQNFFQRFDDAGDTCRTEHLAPLPNDACLPPTPEESRRLREWFVRGEPMPLNEAAEINVQHLRDIQRWIAAGAICGE
jgi:hypothetical protein